MLYALAVIVATVVLHVALVGFVSLTGLPLMLFSGAVIVWSVVVILDQRDHERRRRDRAGRP